MQFLSQEAFQRARSFVMDQGRRLDQRLWAFYFESGARGDVLAALAAYQNEDGGFCQIEPDIQTEVSSALATTVGFQVLREVEASGGEVMVRKGIRYFLDTLSLEAKVWQIVPPEVEDAPHAPWWNYEKTEEVFGKFLGNPRAEILGYLWAYTDLVPGDVRNLLTDSVLAHLALLPDEMDMFDLMCYQRLAQAANFPHRERVMEKLLRVAPLVVTTDADRWASFSFKPLQAAPTPESPLADVLKEDVQRNLDFEIERQNADGSWSPNWSWGGSFPEGWEKALVEWKSCLTLETVRSLQAYGRVEGVG